MEIFQHNPGAGYDKHRKAVVLYSTAVVDLKMVLGHKALIELNRISGNVYLYDEESSFYIYLPENAEIAKENIMIVWTAFEDDDDIEFPLASLIHEDCPLKSKLDMDARIHSLTFPKLNEWLV